MRLFTLLILAAVIVFFTGAASASMAQVNIKDYKFQPSDITINKGDTITWTNLDTVAHDIKFKDSDSPDLKKGDTYSKTFGQAGTFDYICDIHPTMKGKVIVV
jgi:amicyanin